MSNLEDLYREVILDHYRSPRNRGELPVPPATHVEGFNPLCGDEIQLYLLLDGDTIVDVKMSGHGCSISQSSASMMTAAIKGKSIDAARAIVRSFKAMMTVHEGDLGSDAPTAPGNGAAEGPNLGDLEALRGVVKFPVRIKCATLAWNTLTQALDEAGAGHS
jgi:nitrogen fixation NifU-like protein